ncbi:lipolysis-stimulated lipoprotein receptor-like [Anguilla anguilla]|uniref:lipolysis-stimulated lipoprotein receptor-like n=1 Tax=Anguilla anguilla TaxID=7936 RepID=UPI0015ADD3CC|nr:lipolysis-stimulated lipoprotein receptor-like [Anguilla anguilla]
MWLAVSRCGGVEVTVGEERMFAPLFEEVVLRCRYSSRSSQTPVVQWWYKSYCRGRTADAFGFPQSLLFRRAEPAGSSHLDCSDAARTVRIIASIRDSTATLAEHYRDREDISIINEMDLRIGRLQWGDSGVYQCKVVISDDPEGTNEAQVELLVLGKVGALDDFLPGFDLDFMPDWVFVALVILGGCCCLLLVGICWCQCCPHSCCCYLPCCCCRQRCCCPQHLYEAGKVAGPEPFFISGVPTMLPIVPPSLFQPQMEKNVTGASSLSELSCFPDTDSSTQSCQLVEKKAAPPASDLWVALSSQEQCSQTPPPQRDQAEEHIRWNPRSEHLQRKAFPGSGRGKGRGGRAGSLDELEEFALSYSQRGRRGEARGRGGIQLELREQREAGGAPHPPKKRHGGAPPPDASRGRGQGDGRGEGDTPSKTSSGKSSDCYLSLSPSNQPKQGVPLQPYCNTRPPQDPTRTPRTPRTPKPHRGEHGSHQKTNTCLKRDSLVV